MKTIKAHELAQITTMEELKDVQIKVLDHGHIRVVDWMGDDTALVQAARISYGKGTKSLREDRQLIRRLIRHRHTSPIEMGELKLHVRVPMDTWRQWIRHRTSSVNEYSTRYSEAIDDVATTEPWMWRSQSKTNKQGSADFLGAAEGEYLSALDDALREHAANVYKEKLVRGVAREQARANLLLSNYTEAYWKIDLHNLLNFLRLRMAADAQWEIRQYANVIGQIVKLWCPLTWEAFTDYIQESSTFSRYEMLMLLQLIKKANTTQEEITTLLEQLQTPHGHPALSKNEIQEFLEKIKV